MEKFIPDPARLQAVEENWKRVLDRVQEGAVKSGRDPREVRLMAVTKTVEPVYINRALDLGADLIGENRVQEYLGKRIGRLQTNKVKYIVGQVDMIQSVDSMKLAQEISKQSVKHGVTTQVLVEVNIGREESKSGIMIEALPELLEEAAQLPGLQIKGLMCIPPICETETQVRKYFETMHQSFIDIKDKKHHNIDMDILSMGMSGDFEAAIAEGSTLVRVGSAIFGARQYR